MKEVEFKIYVHKIKKGSLIGGRQLEQVGSLPRPASGSLRFYGEEVKVHRQHRSIAVQSRIAGDGLRAFRRVVLRVCPRSVVSTALDLWGAASDHTFSMKDARNLTIRFIESSDSSLSAESSENMSTK